MSGVAGAAASAVRGAREAVRLISLIREDAELDRLLPSIGVEADFPKTLPARSPPMFVGDEDTQLDPRAEAWDGVDEERAED